MSLEPIRHASCGLAGASSRRHHVSPAATLASWRNAFLAFLMLSLAATSSLAVTVEVRPAVSADDAEESSTGSMYLNSSDLEMVQDATTQWVGIRWPGVAIPAGATITSAWVQFVAEEPRSEATTLTFRAQAADNALAFTSTKFNVSTRALGTQSVSWTPAAWTTGQAGAAQRSPELADLIRAVVSRPGWASGNAIVLVITGSGCRTSYAQDGSPTQAPLLHVEYTTSGGPPPNQTPVANLVVTPLASPALSVSASGAGSTDDTGIASYRFTWGDGTSASVTSAPTTVATHTYAAAGTYTVTLTVTDTGGLTSAPVTASVTVSSGGGGGGTSTTVEQRTLASTDDAEESATGAVKTSSSDLELVQDGSAQTVGMRWPNLTIPRGATITAAWVQFAARSADAGTTSLLFRAQAADNAPAFTTATQNISSRLRTGASVNWSPAAWTAGAAGAEQRTPDLKSLVQEVVNRSGWASGNALAMIVTGSGRRAALSRDGDRTRSPQLHVEYTGGGGGGGPAPNQPPVAQLAVTNISSPPLSVSASGAGSTDDNGIASYRFTWGDGTSATVTNAPTAVATHTYASTGTYTVTLIVTDTGGLTSAPVTQQVTVTSSSSGPLAVYVGYYDTHHPDGTRPKPNPWQGSSGVVFVGTPDSPSGGWDTSALRLDNLTSSSVTVTVTVDIGSNRFALWGSRSIPAGQKLILAQTGFENFDGSDTNPAGCYGCNDNLCLTQVQSTVPVVNVTVGGVTTRYYDTTQILNTDGVDAAGCPPTSGRWDESRNWVRVFTTQGTAPEAVSAASLDEETVRAGRLWLAPPFPNPARDELSLRFQVPTRGVVTLEIYDLMGRRVASELDHEIEAGEYVKIVPVRNMAAGRYFARLRTSEGMLHQSFVISR